MGLPRSLLELAMTSQMATLPMVARHDNVKRLIAFILKREWLPPIFAY